ncbi:MAG: GNAT family N-acetyltransferase [Parvibaculum sp.]
MEIRRAKPEDVPAIRALVEAAYARYVPLIGKPPGPMLDDYEERIRNDLVFLSETGEGLAAVLVLIEKAGYLLLDNIAVAPACQGRGYGARLIRFAEEEAKRLGLVEIHLYTHEVMHENIGLYERFGFAVTHRAREAGYDRVYMNKKL